MYQRPRHSDQANTWPRFPYYRWPRSCVNDLAIQTRPTPRPPVSCRDADGQCQRPRHSDQANTGITPGTTSRSSGSVNDLAIQTRPTRLSGSGHGILIHCVNDLAIQTRSTHVPRYRSGFKGVIVSTTSPFRPGQHTSFRNPNRLATMCQRPRHSDQVNTKFGDAYVRARDFVSTTSPFRPGQHGITHTATAERVSVSTTSPFRPGQHWEFSAGPRYVVDVSTTSPFRPGQHCPAWPCPPCGFCRVNDLAIQTRSTHDFGDVPATGLEVSTTSPFRPGQHGCR